MKLEIYNQSGVLKAIVEPSESSTHHKALMADNVLRLSFTHFEYIPLEVNDYTIFEGERFMLRDDYRPTMKSTIEYQYDVEFCGIESYLKDALVLFLTDGEDDPTFSLTDTAARHAQIVVDNVNRITGTKDWVLGEVVASGNKTITYEGMYCFDALSKIAEVFETEWWVEGTTIHISRCEHGEAIDLGYGKGLLTLTKSDNDQAPFFTRLFPIGSSRNIDKSVYGHTRLQLPGGAKYVENNTNYYGIKEKYEQEAFSHIYPRRVGTVSSIRTEVAKGEDGEDFTIYHVRDTSIPFDVNNYLMEGKVLTMSFEPPAELGGYEFEVESYDHAEKEFRLVTQFPTDDMQLPGGLLIPSPGDPYILFNMALPETYYREAEIEYKNAVDEWIIKYSQDVSVYRSLSHYLYFRQNDIDLKLGRRVRLLSDVYFTKGHHATRVTSITRKLWRPEDMEIECCYAVTPGRLAQLESGVVDIQTAFKEYLNQEHLQVLKSWDSADPTEYNVLSSVRTIRAIGNTIKKWAEEADLKYLRKDIEDTAAEMITFANGLEVVGTALLENMTVRDKAVFLETLSSEKFVSGFPAGSGWALMWKEFINAAGVTERKAMMELDEITVRGALRVYEMIISQLVGENGTRLTTDMMRVSSIDTAAKKIYLDTEKGVLYNPFRSGDILMVQRFGGIPTGGGDNTNMIKSYEMVVDEVGIGTDPGEDRLDWLTYSTFTGDVRDVAERDVLTRVDSLYNDDRKGIIKHTSVEPGSPYIDVIYGMKTDPENAVRSRLGRMTGLFDYWWGQLTGYGLMSDNAYLRGVFQLQNGNDVRTEFEILEGRLRSAIQSVTYNLTEEDNFLSNATFTRDMEDWEHDSDIDLYQFDGALLDLGTNFLCGKHSVAEVVEYDGKQMLRLRDSFVRQKNEYIRKPDDDSELYIGFRYKVEMGGTLRVGFEDTEGEGLQVEEFYLSPNVEYKTFDRAGYWDGTGDFFLAFDGDIYIELLSLANRPLDDYKKQVSTLFEQTDEYIRAVAEEVNEMDGYIKTAGWITEADGHKWWATHEDVDELGNRVTTHESSFHVTAYKIEAMVRAIEAVENDFSNLDYYVKTAGWITTADGHRLWATIDEVDLLGQSQRRHESSFHVTAEKITSIVTSLEDTEQWQSKMEQTADRLSLTINSNTGKMLYKDPTFKEGVNSTALYNNSGGTGLIYERVAKTSDVPTDSTHMMKLTFIHGSTTSPGLGGFRWGNASRANAVFEAHIIAKIPQGYTLTFASNGYGTGSKHTWLTSQEGTGNWATYVCRVECGGSGTFSTTNFFYIAGEKPTVQYSTNGSAWYDYYFEEAVYYRRYNAETEKWGTTTNLAANPNINKLIWYVCSATVYDLYVFEDVVSSINLTPGEVKIKADKISLEGLVTVNGYVKITTTGKLIGTDVELSGKITATSGFIGGLSINAQGLYYGSPSYWTTSSYKQDLALMTPGTVRLQKQLGYFNPGDIANIKVAIGDGADPTLTGNRSCYSAGYFYRQMNPDSSSDYYYPAVKIISDNVVNRNVALRTKGALVCEGGLAGMGHFNNANNVTVLDFSFGTTMLVYNTTRRYVYLPTYAIMRQFLGVTGNFCVPVRIIAQYNNTANFLVAFQTGQTSLYFRNHNGGKWKDDVEMGAGDYLEILLIYNGSYYAQLMNHHN